MLAPVDRDPDTAGAMPGNPERPRLGGRRRRVRARHDARRAHPERNAHDSPDPLTTTQAVIDAACGSVCLCLTLVAAAVAARRSAHLHPVGHDLDVRPRSPAYSRSFPSPCTAPCGPSLRSPCSRFPPPLVYAIYLGRTDRDGGPGGGPFVLVAA